MGMFTKDKKMAPDGYLTEFAPAPDLTDGQQYADGTEFILWGASVADEEWPTDIGTTTMCHLAVAHKDTPDDIKIVSALGAPIGDKVKDKEDGELPALVRSRKVKNKKEGFGDAFVINFIAPHKGKEVEVKVPE